MSEATPQTLTPAPPEVADQSIDGPRILIVRRGLLTPDPDQPRKRFVPTALQELAESIKSHGVLSPILARPNPHWAEGNGMPPYMIVAGECRWRASGLADQLTVPMLLRKLTNFEVAEIQLTENLHRNNLHPLEEAEALSRLLRAPDRSEGFADAETLGAHLGKSRRWVYNRLVLLNLSEHMRMRFLADEFTTSIAQRIAVYVHQHADQLEALKRILVGFGGEPMSTRTAEDYLRKEFTLKLDGARFDVAASYQCAGPCGKCPKRTGANPDLFDDVQTSDLCQDRACFDSKVYEHRQGQLEEARSKGATVMEGDEALKFMPRENVMPTGYLPFHAVATALTADRRLLSEIFGNKARGVVVVDHPHRGFLQWVVGEADARKLLKSKGLLRAETPKANITSAAATVSIPEATPAEPPARKAAQVMPLMTKQQRDQALETMMDEGFSERLFLALHQRLTTAQELPLLPLRRMLSDLIDFGDLPDDALALMYKARGWEDPSDIDFERRIKGANGRELGELLIESLYARELAHGLSLDDLRSGDDHSSAMAELYEIDLNVLNNAAFREAELAVDAEQAKRQAAIDAAGPADATQAFVAAHGGKAGTVKYRNKATGESWSGRGLQPKWMLAAIRAGAKLSDFEVTP